MINSKHLNERLKLLGWKVFHLSKQVAEIRARRGNATSPSSINTTIAKAINNPKKSGVQTLEDIVTALGGEIKIVWKSEPVFNKQVKSDSNLVTSEEDSNNSKEIRIEITQMQKQDPLMQYESEITAEAFSYRLIELRWTLYKLAKEYAAVMGTNSSAARYHSSLGKILAAPDKSSLATIKAVLRALRGEIIIQWQDVPEEDKGKQINTRSTEERLENLENLLFQVLQKFSTKESGE